MPSATITKWNDSAHRLGLLISHQAPLITICRHDFKLLLDESILLDMSIDDAVSRSRVHWILFGIRLGFDYLASDYTPTQERPTQSKRAFRTHEAPSVYGNRLMRLIPRITLQWMQSIINTSIWHSPWITPDMVIVYIMEIGKCLHTLSVEQFKATGLPQDKLERDARAALFYDSYRIKPRARINHETAKIRRYQTTEGLGASRALILPDYDYDAAQENGFFAIPSRDQLIVVEPQQGSDPNALVPYLEELIETEFSQSPAPISRAIFSMTSNALVNPSQLPAAPHLIEASLFPPRHLEVEYLS